MAEQHERHCVHHPDRAAIETCEICGDPLCGYCLYYTEDRQRLCEKHAHAAKANGLRIIPPAVYAEGIIPSQAEAKRQADEIEVQQSGSKIVLEKNRPFYQGNNQDLNAFLSMILGVVTLSACCGSTYCLPFVAVLLGILALINAKDAVDPRRARQQAWIGIFSGGCLVLIIVGVIAFYIFIYGAAIASLNSNTSNFTPLSFPTSTVTAAPTRTTTPPPNVEPNQLTATAKAETDQNSSDLDFNIPATGATPTQLE